MKLNARERSVAIALFSTPAVQAIVELGQWKVSGEVGSIAHRCGEAAKAFVAESLKRNASSQLVALAQAIFAGAAGSYLMSGQGVGFADRAFNLASSVVEYLELDEAPQQDQPQQDPPKSEEQKEQSSGPTVTDVPTEKLELPPKTIEQLLAQSTGEVDLSTALKLRAYDKAKGLESLTHVGESVAKKIREAIDKAVGPEVPA